MLLTNIIEEGSELMFDGADAADVLSKAFHTEVKDGQTVDLPGVVSRKKAVRSVHNIRPAKIKQMSRWDKILYMIPLRRRYSPKGVSPLALCG